MELGQLRAPAIITIGHLRIASRYFRIPGRHQSKPLCQLIRNCGAGDAEQECRSIVAGSHNGLAILREIQALGENHFADQEKFVIQNLSEFMLVMCFTRRYRAFARFAIVGWKFV